MATMLAAAISDQKRLVRGEFWLWARSRLRARDHIHHAAWNVLIIAGPSPQEEIDAIRAVMPRAHITAVDIKEENILKAMDNGVNEAFVCDIGAMQKFTNGTGTHHKTIPPEELAEKRYDVIALDLTGPANDWLKDVVGCYWRQLERKGVMLVTFSYGRDVVEAQNEEYDRFLGKAGEYVKTSAHSGYWYYQSHHNSLTVLKEFPDTIAVRVWYALRVKCNDLETCIQYRGNQMPMVACMLSKNKPTLHADFRALDPDDLRYALTNEELNLSLMYATPAERIDAFRKNAVRKNAAAKAVETRKRRKLAKPETKLLTYSGNGEPQPETDNG